MVERVVSEGNGQIGLIVAAFGFVCWLAGWHMSVRSSGKMYDEGYRKGYSDRGCFDTGMAREDAKSAKEEK